MEKKLILIIFLVLFFIFPPPLGAELERFNFKIIKVAFMNGYARALSNDISKIEYLKGHSDYLKEYITNEVVKYMTEVAELNKRVYETGKSKPASGAVQSKGVW